MASTFLDGTYLCLYIYCDVSKVVHCQQERMVDKSVELFSTPQMSFHMASYIEERDSTIISGRNVLQN